jgi:PAS domain S-box-containing protein
MPEDTGATDPVIAAARLEAVLEGITDGFYALDTEWRYVLFNRAAEAYFGVARADILGRTMQEMFPQGKGTYFEQRCQAAMHEGQSSRFETRSRLRPERTVELHIYPMRGGGIAVVLTDITDRLAADERRRLLVNELNHRVKNTLATVQAIAAQSLKDAPPQVRKSFTERLMALARANDVLVADAWRGATVAAIAQQVASPYAGRITCEGDEAHLPSKSAMALALALHELATNAAKYGALSAPEGQVSLTWTVGAERFTLVWRERGGPPVSAPDRQGFGARLIKRGLSQELAAEVSLDYAREGLTCTVDAPATVLGSD